MQNNMNFLEDLNNVLNQYQPIIKLSQNLKHLASVSENLRELAAIQASLADLPIVPMQNLANAVQQASKRRPYIKQFKRKFLSFSLGLNYSDLFACVDIYIKNAPSDNEFPILSLVKEKAFAEMVLSRCNTLNFANTSRRALFIQEIFYLIRRECYSGAIALLYGQFEGLLTDFLIDQNKLKYKGKRLIYKNEDFQYLDNPNHG